MKVKDGLQVSFLIVILLLVSSFPSFCQDDRDRKVIKELSGEGFSRHSFSNFRDRLESREGKVFSDELAEKDVKRLFATGIFEKVNYRVDELADTPGFIKLTFMVNEYRIIKGVEINGLKYFNKKEIEPNLRLKVADMLNPYFLKIDKSYLTDTYQGKGYHFVDVKEEILDTDGGILLRWNIREGPLVTVESVEFSGNESVSASALKGVMLTKENGWFSSGPYIEKNLREDLERVKLYYRLDGWLDIFGENKVFVEDISFNDDKTKIFIKIHIEEGEKYKINKISVKGSTVFKEDEILIWLKSKEGAYYTENNLQVDIGKIREKYGEIAYTAVEINPKQVFHRDAKILDLVFEIKENEKTRVGRITIRGNDRTRDDVIRRDIRIYPGEDFNSKELDKSIKRLRDKRYFDPNIEVTQQDGEEPNTRDITINVKEIQTGNIRFAGGYNTNFGVVGLVELSQRNFDAANTPESFSDVFTGKAFSGGGQFMRLAVSPGMKRSTYRADFREPYMFGYSYGTGLSAFKVGTIWETYEEDRVGGSIGFDKRWWDDYLVTSIGLDFSSFSIDSVKNNAPQAVKDLEGNNRKFSMTPAIRYDTRDSQFMSTEGYTVGLSYEYAGGFLPGDFDFTKARFDMAYFYPIYTMEDGRKHVIGFNTELGLADPADGDKDLPIFERFFAGGANSIRGFRFRGIGPRQSGQPLGGRALAFGSANYSFPIYENVLRGVVFYDMANLDKSFGAMETDTFRMSAGFGIRLTIQQFGGVPFALDFGFPVHKESDDKTSLITFDMGVLF